MAAITYKLPPGSWDSHVHVVDEVWMAGMLGKAALLTEDCRIVSHSLQIGRIRLKKQIWTTYFGLKGAWALTMSA